MAEGLASAPPSFGIMALGVAEDLPQRGAKQHPRLGAIPEGGRTGRRRVAARGGTAHLPRGYTRRTGPVTEREPTGGRVLGNASAVEAPHDLR